MFFFLNFPQCFWYFMKSFWLLWSLEGPPVQNELDKKASFLRESEVPWQHGFVGSCCDGWPISKSVEPVCHLLLKEIRHQLVTQLGLGVYHVSAIQERRLRGHRTQSKSRLAWWVGSHPSSRMTRSLFFKVHVISHVEGYYKSHTRTKSHPHAYVWYV